MFSRPWPITLVSLINFALGIPGLVMLCVPMYRVHFESIIPYVLVSAVNMTLTGVGLWRVKRWAPVAFTTIWLALHIYYTVMGRHPEAGWIGLVLVWGVSLYYWRRLD
ncbi:hypothetical protein AACH06_28105 [Ideonella sp. DXS29W]|uniref:Uncharacterized protein n=1 Tax=Ideonella lacteola TaxID=2984193 RepID=A0ABU9BY55_9BURK